VSVSLSHNAVWGVHDYRLICTEDTLICDHGTITNKDGVIVASDERRSPNRRQDREFVESIREKRPSAIDASTVLPAMHVLQQAWSAHMG
jgi:hypothetical protein